jgi:hypothetical protein
MTTISTIVNIDVLDINEAPQFLDYGSSVVIGYPDRTYFDPSVQMPLITVKVGLSILKFSFGFSQILDYLFIYFNFF